MTYRALTPWQILERRTLVERHWLTLHEDRVRLANGREMAEFHVIDAPSWAGILCVTPEEEIVLVRQYRHGIASESLELPAGVIESGEEPRAGAERELREETGYVSEQWAPIVSLATEPSRHTVRAHFFCARGAVQTGATELDESEDIDVVRVPLREFGRLLDEGGIIHGVHLAAILLAARRGFIAL